MGNQLVGEDFKDRLRTSARLGRDVKTCSTLFECQQLEAIAGANDTSMTLENHSVAKKEK
jgi:hypothetical protein